MCIRDRRKFNNHLKSLSRKLRLHSSVTSYTLRHSWATTAKYRGVPIAVSYTHLAEGKLERKNFDFIVLNSLNDAGAGFRYDTNKISIIDRKGWLLDTSRCV